MALIVGLTGGIACGKSVVSTFFAELGAEVIDADEISRELSSDTGAALPAMRQRWGRAVFDVSGSLNRAALRTLVFQDERELQALEAILHPLIRAQIQARVAKLSSYGLLSVPLLFEKGFAEYCRYTVVVDIDLRRQLQRARQRDQASSKTITAIMAQQSSRLEKLSRASFVIDNRADLAATRAQVVQLHETFAKSPFLPPALLPNAHL